MRARTYMLIIVIVFTTHIYAQYGIKELPIYQNHKLVRLDYENKSGEKAVTNFEYNDDGFISKAKWQLNDKSRSGTITYKYDEMGNIVEKNRLFSDGVTINQSFEYDKSSNLIIDNFERSDGTMGKVEYLYDENGKLLQANCNKQNGWFSGIINYKHNEKDNIIKGNLIQKDIVIGTISYEYGINGLLIKEYWEFPGQWDQTFIYDYKQSKNYNNNQLNSDNLIEIASSEQLWTGVAVSQKGRIFVNYPRWGTSINMSVAELSPSGEFIPYPNKKWNEWSNKISPNNHFYCVQSVYIDKDNYLWILDSGNPGLTGIVKNAPKLLKVDLANDEVVKIFQFNDSYIKDNSYLNDVRIDINNNFAYLTDSGDGAIIIVNLSNSKTRRVLDNHHSTEADKISINVENIDLLVSIHSDGIALSPDYKYLYYKALSSRKLYRVKTIVLRDFLKTDVEIESEVEFMYNSGVSDGMAFDDNGYIYFTSLEKNAITRWKPPNGDLVTVISGSQIKWPDSISIIPKLDLYFTTSQLHLGALRQEPFRLYKIKIKHK